ncbi:MAG: hypothetical protein JST61_02420 [Acidobacteria bacterium]|nr:hypothetical protein [Acidobacteriota bacterium]
MHTEDTSASLSQRPNGAGAAAVLSAGIGVFVLGILTLAGDKSPAIKNALIFYKPTGALSGVTSLAIVAWLASWLLLHLRWNRRELPLKAIATAAFALLALSLLLTFPPFIDAI